MGVPISNVTRRVVYTASGTGPYSFTFEILANTDIAVYKDDALLTLTTDYTVTINSNGTGSITLTASPTGATQIAIVGNRAIKRTTDFVTGGDFFANTVNDEMDQQTIFAQQNAEGLLRALIAPQTDPTDIDMTLPRASVRANKNLAFDADGNPVVGEAIGDYQEDWTTGTAYNKRDIVKDPDNSNIYYCLTAHTSSGSAPISTNTDSAKWSLLIDAVDASDSADAAAQSASDAADSASDAADSATAAASSASAASSSASTASTQATNAASSASSASSSASTATTKASEASTSASNASTSATNAASSASSASTSASTATTKASEASTSASNASTSATNASNSASSASSSASTATTQATNAASSASAASTSASNASSSASAASASASAASTSETNAAASAASAASALDSFDDRYLGSKTSDPTVDNDGNALVTGALYYNSSSQVMKVYDGANWIAATAAGTTSMLVYKYVATAGQTTFSGAATVGGTMSYTSGNILVFVNGASLDSTDYTATNGTSVVLGSAASLNDEVVIVAFKSFTVADTYTKGEVDAFAVKLTGTQTVAGTKTFSSEISVPNTFGFKNRIINGDMTIAQRGVGPTTCGHQTTTYALDRFGIYKDNTSATVTMTQSSTAPAGFSKSLLVTVTTGSAPTSGQELQLRQSIEGYNVADFCWGTADAVDVTLSFRVRSSLTGTFAVGVQSNGSATTYVTTYTINSANTWETKTVTIPKITTGTWNSDNGATFNLIWDLGGGSNYNTTANTWTSGNYYTVAGTTKLVSTTNATLYLTGVQLEKGTQATSFDFRSIGQELALCQRYYQKTYNLDVAPGTNTDLGLPTITVGTYNAAEYCTVQLKVSMRAAPSVSYYTQTGTLGSIDVFTTSANATSSSVTLANIGSNSFRIQISRAGDTLANFHWTASSEF